jgi:hypothetical protein
MLIMFSAVAWTRPNLRASSGDAGTGMPTSP